MGIFKKYRAAFAVVLPVLIIVLARTISSNHFRPDAKELAAATLTRSNLLSAIEINALPGNKLLIYLDEEVKAETGIAESVNIRPDSIIVKSNFSKIKKFKGKVILSSTDPSVSARVWMVLSQMGIKELYILTYDQDNESFKNKFRPDTVTGPESESI